MTSESGSPRTSGRPDDRAAQILSAAGKLFALSGFDQTSVSDIAGAVGVADGAIYKHFRSKREILYEVIREFYEPVIDDATANVAGIPGLRDQMRYLIWLQVLAFTERPDLCRLIIAEARPMEDYYESEIADLNRRYTSLIMDVVEAGQASGAFRDDVEPTMVRDLVYGGIEHIAWGAVTGRSDVHVDSVADDLTSLVCGGLEPRIGNDRGESLSTQVARLEALVDGPHR